MDVVDSLRSLGVKVVTPLDPAGEWSSHSATLNRRIPVIPAIVIIPSTITEVSQAVRHVGLAGHKIQARSGGHSYASHSNGGVDGSVVIDLQRFREIVQLPNGSYRVGAGVRLGELGLALFQQGGNAVAYGTCPDVGIGGHFTHGGFGPHARAWGLAMDHVIAFDVVTADGTELRASATENTLYFQAMRGAPDSFGIIVNFYLHVQPAPKEFVSWSIKVPRATTTVENAVQTFESVAEFVKTSPSVDRRLGLVIWLAHDRFDLEGYYLGDIAELTSTLLSPLKERLGGTEASVRAVGWQKHVEANFKDIGSCEAHSFFAKSVVVANPGLSHDALNEYFEYLLQRGPSAPVGYWAAVQLHGGADSQINVKRAKEALGHRDVMWIFQHYATVTDSTQTFPEEGIRFMDGLNKALGPGHGASNNYPDPSLERDEALRLYYGDKLASLMDLKQQLDPQNVFCHPQSIPPSQ